VAGVASLRQRCGAVCNARFDFVFLFSHRIAIILPPPTNYFASERIFLLTYIDIRNRFASVKKRTTVWLPLDLIERLKKLSRKTGAPMAELFRRAVETYVRRQT
jgi:Ribbon-helix-helix protein, copG family